MSSGLQKINILHFAYLYMQKNHALKFFIVAIIAANYDLVTTKRNFYFLFMLHEVVLNLHVSSSSEEFNIEDQSESSHSESVVYTIVSLNIMMS